MIREELLEILRCPVDRERLSLADASLLDRVNDAIRNGRLTNRSGQQVEDTMEQGLVSQDGQRLYQVVDDIPKLLADECILIEPFSSDPFSSKQEESS